MWRLRTNVKKSVQEHEVYQGKGSFSAQLLDGYRKQVQANKHLGVLLSEDLSWKSHIFAVVAKSNILLGLLKRTFGKRSKALLVGYNEIIEGLWAKTP